MKRTFFPFKRTIEQCLKTTQRHGYAIPTSPIPFSQFYNSYSTFGYQKKTIQHTYNLLNDMRIDNKPLTPSMKHSIIKLHTTLLRSYVTNQPNKKESSLEKETEQSRKRLERQRFKEKTMYSIFFMCLLGVIIFTLGHLLNPYGSTIDNMLKLILGEKYRTYVDTSGFFFKSSFFKEPTHVYAPPSRIFELTVPAWFETEGIWILDKTDIYRGSVSMRDIHKQELRLEWVPIKNQLAANGQTQFTPLDEILKGCVYSQLKKLEQSLKNIEEKSTLRLQRAEYMDPFHMDTLIDPLPTEPKSQLCNMIYRVHKSWESHIWFFGPDEKILHLCHRYPEAVVNKLIKENHLSQMSEENRCKRLGLIFRNRIYENYDQSTFPYKLVENALNKSIVSPEEMELSLAKHKEDTRLKELAERDE